MQKLGLEELRNHHRDNLKKLRRDERRKRTRKTKEHQRRMFFENPHRFIKALLHTAKIGELCIEEHLKQTYSDARRDEPLGSI